jgi:hypothetical protein
MSKILRHWDKVEKECNIEVKSEYEEIFGMYFPNGINIGREVGEKLNNGEQPWPTLLQFEALDSGLSKGFLTSFGVCVVGEHDMFSDFSTIVNSTYGYSVSFEKIDNIEELQRRYPDTEYHTYPDIQQWTMPGVLIHYSKDI